VKVIYHADSNILCIKCILDLVLSFFLDADINSFFWKANKFSNTCTCLVVPCLWQALKEALAQIRVCSRLEGLLLKKKFLSNGDTQEVHAQKVWFSLAVGSLLGYISKA
jgi:hypothetical protein